MKPFETLPSRVKYYLLDYKDTYMDEVYDRFGKSSLRLFTKRELLLLWQLATSRDINTIASLKKLK